MTDKSKRQVGIWLMLGVTLIFVQVLIGGITRLTESGLSITEWNVVMGTLPPISADDWQQEFTKYQQSPQYQKVNMGMSLQSFKFIYFWEWFHRLYARTMGLVFIVPFFYFLFSKKLNKQYLRKTLVIFLLGGVVGIFGWLMVASGLNDRPMVSPYRLALHLSMAIVTMCYTLWVAMELLSNKLPQRQQYSGLRKFSFVLTALVGVQIILGALVSGMRAAKYYPSWPGMNGEYFPQALQKAEYWTWQAFMEFDTTIFANAFVQFFHRNTATLITLLLLQFIWKAWKKIKAAPQLFDSGTLTALRFLPIVLFTQVLLGIFTVINAIPTTPVALGVIHQGVAMLLLMNMLFINFKLRGGGVGRSKGR